MSFVLIRYYFTVNYGFSSNDDNEQNEKWEEKKITLTLAF